MKILIVKDRVSKEELEEIAKEFYVDMIKGVVDIENKVVAFGGEYHIDASNKLNSLGYSQKNIWGFNIYLNESKDKWLEYISLINIKPGVNKSMEVGDESIKAEIKKILDKLIQ